MKNLIPGRGTMDRDYAKVLAEHRERGKTLMYMMPGDLTPTMKI
jgi:hypothetical protein